MTDSIWPAKLWAWTHDPAEKALILMRRHGGHEAGTVAELRAAIFGAAEGGAWEAIARSADRQAAAADRPQFPYRRDDPRYPAWAQPRFYEQPELIHPLSGDRVAMTTLAADFSAEEAEAASFAHLRGLVVERDGTVDLRRTALALWRFAAATPYEHLGALWGLLPADSRVPDHSIFAHLDLVSALAGALAADRSGTPALLVVSIGPVQDFIAQARTTSDLWAGSHLLSRLAWEAMRVVAADFGPDAILFPALRGNPLVDLWLRDEEQLAPSLFDQEAWTKLRSDANPLFSAALPNKFVALVPADGARGLASRIGSAVRAFAKAQADAAAERLFNQRETGVSAPAREQITKQMSAFPEVHWAAVPWSLASDAAPSDPAGLAAALRPFHGGEIPFFASEGGLWPLLCGDTALDGQRFFDPNRGALYSQFYELADRSLAAAKSLRDFAQLPQAGYRCSLCGEREWLCEDRADLARYREGGQPWEALAARAPRLCKSERLCALCTLKRFWPTLFCEQLGEVLGSGVRRYNVSTHAMAVAPLLARAAAEPGLAAAVARLVGQAPCRPEEVALPPRLARLVHDGALPGEAKCFPGLLGEDEGDEIARQAAEAKIKAAFGERPEGYYALALLDGDRMGEWVAAGPDRTLSFEQSWHSLVAGEMRARAYDNVALRAYCQHSRPGSPARQAAISEALNNFALRLAPAAIERWHDGKLLYAGGDDVLALLPATQAFSALLALRLVYSGIMPEGSAEWLAANTPACAKPNCGRGYTLLDGQLRRAMGGTASLSGGLVIAHFMTPLGAVLRAARQAERRAKTAAKQFPAGALAISLLKRAGGETRLVLPWWAGEAPALAALGPALLCDFAAWLRAASRGFLYQLRERLAFAPKLAGAELAELLRDACLYQAERQKKGKEVPRALLENIVGYILQTGADAPCERLLDFFAVAEFLGRERRHSAATEPALEAVAP